MNTSVVMQALNDLMDDKSDMASSMVRLEQLAQEAQEAKKVIEQRLNDALALNKFLHTVLADTHELLADPDNISAIEVARSKITYTLKYAAKHGRQP